MHIKDYSTHPENIELKGMLDERPEILLRIIRRTYNNIRNILKKLKKKDPNA
jgi:hypothetical protein